MLELAIFHTEGDREGGGVYPHAPMISNPSVRVTIHYNLQDMYMHTRPPFVLQGMVALPSFIILDFCVCNFNLVWSDSPSAELWLSVDTHHDTGHSCMQSWPIWGMLGVWIQWNGNGGIVE